MLFLCFSRIASQCARTGIYLRNMYKNYQVSLSSASLCLQFTLKNNSKNFLTLTKFFFLIFDSLFCIFAKFTSNCTQPKLHTSSIDSKTHDLEKPTN